MSNTTLEREDPPDRTGYCPTCTNAVECVWVCGTVGYPCENCHFMDSEADGDHYIAFGWDDYCGCLPWEEHCHACYKKKVNDFREQMEAARAAIEIVSTRQNE